jgi:inosine-uridine nucleoside N-ribohydrolase
VTRTLIIDTDPGSDDAIAILFALGAVEELNVLALTAVAGNVSLDRTVRNACIIRDWAGRSDLPVYAGCSRPLVRDLVIDEVVFGQSGLGGIALPEPSAAPQDGHAVSFLIDSLLHAEEKSITLCPIGPLTNIAMVLLYTPEAKRGVREIVLMGGAYFEGGNITPSAEFNIYVDPHAADVVFRSGIPITVLPLDVTHQALTSSTRVERFRQIGNRAGEIVAQLLTSYARYDIEVHGLEGGALHDPCVIGYLLAPELFSGRQVNVMVETSSPLTLGATVVDWCRVTGREPNATWINGIDADKFFALLTEKIARLP